MDLVLEVHRTIGEQHGNRSRGTDGHIHDLGIKGMLVAAGRCVLWRFDFQRISKITIYLIYRMRSFTLNYHEKHKLSYMPNHNGHFLV